MTVFTVVVVVVVAVDMIAPNVVVNFSVYSKPKSSHELSVKSLGAGVDGYGYRRLGFTLTHQQDVFRWFANACNIPSHTVNNLRQIINMLTIPIISFQKNKNKPNIFLF